MASHHEFWASKEWILTIKDEFESLVVNYPLVISLFKKHNHVFPKEIPSDLPLKHDVQHWWGPSHQGSQGGWESQGGPGSYQGCQGDSDHGQKPLISGLKHSVQFTQKPPDFCAPASPSSLGYDRLNYCLFSSFRSQLSNKTSCKLFGGHLISQPGQNFRLCCTGSNPVKGCLLYTSDAADE